MKAIGLPALAVAEELKPRRLYDLFLELRTSIGMDVVGLSDPAVGRKLAIALGENRMVALVADRDFTGRGVEVEMFGRKRTIPAGPALLSLTTGAPLIVTPTYTTPDRLAHRDPRAADHRANGRQAGGRACPHDPDGPKLRGGDRGRAFGLAHVPAGLVVRVAFACPYAWDDPGGVQVHVRELAGTMIGRGHEVLVLAPVRHRAAESWVRAVGRPVDITYNRSNAPIDPRPWSFLRVARGPASVPTRRRARARAVHAEHVDVDDPRR